jgi:hypothetical protein
LVGQVAEDMSIAIQYRLCALAGLLSAGRAAGSYARGGLLVRAT